MKPRPSYLVIFILLAAAIFAVIILKDRAGSERNAEVMGTNLRVKVNGPNAARSIEEAISEIRRLDKIYSRFDEKSEISRVNSAAGKMPVKVSDDTFKALDMAVRVNRLSRWAFDITLGHPRDLVIDRQNRTVFLKKAGERIDLGGIGKGYAVESARRLLLKRGVKSAIIDMHSSIAVIGNGWRVGIRDPKDAERILGVVILNDGEALSTSAQYEQPGHILDPRTGKPADRCLSVTVIARDGTLADALSTAVFVLGPEEGMQLLKSLGAEALIVDNKGNIRTLGPRLGNSGCK
jgi:thiamine biosynthesis lipoprotein